MHLADNANPSSLLRLARLGRRDSLGDLLQLYRNYLSLLARAQIDLHLPARANPSDVVQDTFLLACREFHQFRGNSEGELVSWLRRILINNIGHLVEKQFLTQKRDGRREVPAEWNHLTLDRSSAQHDAAVPGHFNTPSLFAQRREVSAWVAEQLAKLPADYREVIVLRNLEGQAFEEVARRMNRSAGAVRILWLRALDKLRQLNQGENLL